MSGRRTALLLLYLTLFIILTVGFVWIYREYESRREMKAVQELASVEAEPTPEPMSDTDIAKFTHLPEVRPVLRSTPEPQPVNEKVLSRIEKLYSENKDLAGWLSIPGTDINYPVMYRADDNDFYLKHNFYGEDDINGLLVLDKRCLPDGSGLNNLIHGHNMKSGAMFGTLKNYLDPAWYKDHDKIVFSTLYEEKTYEIFAVFKTTVYNESTNDFQYYDYIDIGSKEAFTSYVTNAKEQSLYDTGVEVSWGDRLVTLSTCEYTKENGRLVIVAASKP